MADVSLIAGSAAKEIIENLGFEMADVEYVREDGQMCLNFYIRSKNGVNIDDCETVSRAIDEAVENANPTGNKPYCLCVSTWGDRPLKNDADLDFFLEVLVEIKIKKALTGKKKKFVGLLKAFDKDFVTILIDEEPVSFERTNIDIIRPYIGF